MQGYLVQLGNGQLDDGDLIVDPLVTFTENLSLGAGTWTWSGTYNGTTYTNTVEPGDYWTDASGAVYFVPAYGPVSTITAADATTAPEYSLPDGTVTGTTGDDLIDKGYTGDPDFDRVTETADTIAAGDGNDTVYARDGDDSVIGGAGNDVLHGEFGNDTLDGGIGDDTLYGDALGAADRSAFKWSELPDPSGDGTQIDNDDNIAGGGSQATGGTNVTFTYVANPAGTTDGTGGTDTEPLFKDETEYVTGIDTGTDTMNSGSALVFGGDLATNQVELDFDDPVTNVDFRVNDIDSNGVFTDQVTILAFDALGNPVPVTLTLGSALLGSDTDGDGLIDTATSNGASSGAADASNSILVQIAGPVSQIVVRYTDIQSTGDDGLVNITDVYFDDVTTAAGDDSIAGGAGNDTIFGGAGNDQLQGDDGNDAITGGAGTDTIDGGLGDDVIVGDGTTVDTSGGNLIVNGNFEDTTGMTATSYGHVGTGSVPGWTSTNPGDDIDFHNDGKGGIAGSDGASMLESAGSPTNLDVYQNVTGLTDGQAYQLTLDAGDADPDSDSRMEVYFGGQLIGVIDPSAAGALESFTFDLIGGSGDGTDSLRLVEVGNTDNDGMMVDNVQLYPVTPVAGGAADSITGGAGDDLIYGEVGDDSIAGGTGLDTVYGGSGADTIAGNDGADALYGGTGADSLDGGVSDDVLSGGDGNDTLAGDGGFDSLIGGDGDDTLDGGDQGDALFGGAGNDVLDGGEEMNFGDDDTLYGGDGNDTLTETETDAGSNDVLFGGTGDDTLSSNTGVDTLYGGDDQDRLIITDTSGADLVEGGEGGTDYDILDGSDLTSDAIVNMGMPETGTLTRAGETVTFSEIEEIRTGAGNDSIIGSSGDDTIQTGAGSDVINAGSGNDTINLGDADGADDQVVLTNGFGSDTIIGFDAPTANVDGTFNGIDTLDVSALQDLAGDPVNTNDVTVGNDGAGNAVLSFPNGETITLIGIDHNAANDPFYLNAIGIPLPDGTVSGTSGGDLIDIDYTGDPDGDRVDADDAILPGDTGNDDLIEAGAGNDTVLAGDGDDSILAGSGDDTVFGGSGADSIDGGTGTDSLFGGTGNDTIAGGEYMEGGDGDDFLMTPPGSGATSVYGGAGNDFIVDNGDSTSDDLLDGGSGDDAILGGDGDDTIIGGTGNDMVEGSNGDDTFILNDGFGIDGITAGENFEDGTAGGALPGDVIDASGMSNDVILTFMGAESGELADAGNTPADGDDTNDNTAMFSEVESVLLGTGNDTAIGGIGNDNVHLGGGDDTFVLGDGFGDDQIIGGETGEIAGDTLDGSGLTESVTLTLFDPESGLVQNATQTATFAEMENISTGSGDDTIIGSTGDDTVSSGAGNDTLSGGAGNDTFDGGNDDDTFDGGTGDDTLIGGEGTDTFSLTGAYGNDAVFGGTGGASQIDVLDGSALTENVTVTFTDDEDGTFASTAGTTTFDDIEHVITGSGNDTVTGSAGDEIITTNDGDDVIDTGAGVDTIFAGAGNDTIAAGEGDDINAGAGDDTINLADLIADPSTTSITIDGGAGDETPGVGGGDILNLAGQADVSTLSYVDDGTGSKTGSVTMNDGTVVNFTEIETIVICFTPGTMIATPCGARDIADLRVGDMVVTRDHGLQPIRWIQSRTVAAQDSYAPIRIRPGVVTGLERDLLVSPQHRMLFQGYRAELLFGESEVLVAAKHLVDGMDVTREEGGEVTYIHMMFDEHEIVFADGAATESFHPGKMGLEAVSDPAREELFALFPELRSNVNSYGQTARRCLKRREAKLLRA